MAQRRQYWMTKIMTVPTPCTRRWSRKVRKGEKSCLPAFKKKLVFFQELIQNAEDGGARTVTFLYDQHSYGTESLHHPGLASFQVCSLHMRHKYHLTLRAHFFQTRNMQKKRDILSEKQESGMALKKLEFSPESGNVDTYVHATDHCDVYSESRTSIYSSRQLVHYELISRITFTLSRQIL